MSQLTSTLKVVVNASGARSGSAQVTAYVTAMANSSNKAINSMNARINSFERAMKSANNQLVSFARQAISVAAFYQFSKSIADATQSYASFIAIAKTSTGSLQGAQDSFEYITRVANTLGTNLETNIKVFGKFQAAMKPMDATGELTRHVFEGLSVAAAGLHLNAYQLELSFKAIEQAASKNKPTLEEFQRQLAEHIPGAMVYLAEGVGLRMDQIHDAISKGTVSVKDLVSGLANVLKQRFGEAAEYASKQLPAAIERLRNAFYLFRVEVSNNGGSEGLKAIANSLTDLLTRSDIAKAVGSLYKDVGIAIANFIKSITAEDVNKLGSFIKTATSIIVTFVKNISNIFAVLFSSVIIGNMIKFGTFIVNIASKARTAATGISVLRVAFAGLGVSLTGPLGIIALLTSVIGLLAILDSRKQKPIGISVDVDDKLKMLKQGELIPNAKDELVKNTEQINKYAKLVESYKKNNPSFAAGMEAHLAKLNAYQNLLAKQITQEKSAAGIEGLLDTKTFEPTSPTLKDGKDKDPLKGFIDDTTIAKIREFNELMRILESRKKSMSFEEYANTYQNIRDKFITMVDGAAYFDSTAAEMAKSQNDVINEMQKELDESNKGAKLWLSELKSTFDSAVSELSGDMLRPLTVEIDTWYNDQIKKLKDLGPINSDTLDNLNKYIELIKTAKLEQAKLVSISDQFKSSNDLIGSTEQSLQSRVITGLINENQSRIILRKTIGEQGQALTKNLLPAINEILLKTTNPQTRAEMQMMIDKINEMVEIGKQTTALEGFKSGLREFSNEASDIFTEVKDATVNAFKGMSDALTEYVMTGKANFSDLANSIIRDMIRITMQEMVTKPLAKEFSGAVSTIGSSLFDLFFAKGGAFSGGQVKMFAKGGILGPNGGIFPGPTLFPLANGAALGLGGEAGDEAAMPLKRMPDGKLGVYAEGKGSNTISIDITVNDNRTQTESKSNVDESQVGPKLASMIRETVHSKLIQEMRPGGLLA